MIAQGNLETHSILGYTRVVKRRFGISLLLGVGVTGALSLLSVLAIRLFPYRDLPMMPKPFFLYALAPGILIGELGGHGWSRSVVFLLTNSLFYGVVAFCLITVIHACSRRV